MKRLIYSCFGLLLIALLFLAFNISTGLLLPGARIDLTQQKLYSISSGTRQILSGLDQPIDLYFFYSDSATKGLVPLRGYATRVQELLKAYEHEAKGKIRLRIIDPQPFSEEEDRANGFGLQAAQMGPGAAPIYFGLVGTDVQNNVQIIPLFPLDQEDRLEYDISRLLQTLEKPKRPVVGLLSSLPVNGGFDVKSQRKSEPWMLIKEVRREFDLVDLRSNIMQIPEDIDVLMLLHPKHLPQSTQYAIDQYVLAGGKVLAFVDPLSEQDPGSEYFGITSKDRSSDLATLFKAWGLRMLPDSILGDGSYALFDGAREGPPAVLRPFTLELPAPGLNQNDLSTAGLESINLSTTGILEPIENATTNFIPLMRSSDVAMAFDTARFDSQNASAEVMRELTPHSEPRVIAARIQGAVQSAFPSGIDGHRDGLKQAQEINLIVVADTDLLSDRMWVELEEVDGRPAPRPWADNAFFVINALDNLSGSDALNSVRSRGRYSRPFVRVEQLQRDAEARLREKYYLLQQSLEQTELKLAQLQETHEDKPLISSAEQQMAVRQFIHEKVQIRKELREVQYQLNADIDNLGRTLKVINIAAVPLLLTFCVLIVWGLRRAHRLVVSHRKPRD
ncbi:Gldg family protein [Pseudomonas sp. TH34]|uniref:GldG family protein n=1 Tax=Pseudomonas sp. TH34 TaxID=2796399 RepID=UPI0019144351|nr:Gldg family protein [Pseudomonas sp. TH34]MBK5408869.1 Gldg family protein [Pseudomonas sp. TH34]